MLCRCLSARKPGSQRSRSGGSRQAGSAEDSHFERLWRDLQEGLPYLDGDDMTKVAHAFQVAYGAHKNQKRKSGEPFIVHPVAVACILGELRMDADAVAAGLLHDVVEDTDRFSLAQIEDAFGRPVRNIVEGETKVSKLNHEYVMSASHSERNAFDLQQLFIAMTEEVRIIIVKLADRLHNMRTLKHMPKHKQKKIARETMTIYAPLANLLGLHVIYQELSDLSFMYAEPDQYGALRNRVKQLKLEQSPIVYEARQALMTALEQDAFLQSLLRKGIGRRPSLEIRMANKSLHSLQRKLKASGSRSLRDVQNIAQLHVIVDPEDEAHARQVCYHVLSRVHAVWAPIPGKFKDYVATPKANNYQSIHTSVIPLGSKDLFPLELHIRTRAMNEIAEHGYAAQRWLMSEGRSLEFLSGSANGQNATQSPFRDPKQSLPRANGGNGEGIADGNGNGQAALLTSDDLWQSSWLNSVREWKEEFVGSVSAEEFVETVVGDFLPRSIFVFTPDGTVVSVPKGATVVDFAYLIHTDIGHQMLMAKVNGVPTHPSHELKLAEVVEIVRQRGPPTAEIVERQKGYLNYAKSRSTRHKIVRFIKGNAHLLASASVDKKNLKHTLAKSFSDDDLAEIFKTRYRPGEVFWLILKCQDGLGLLADVASIISASGLSIRAYSGSKNNYSTVFLMNFELHGKAKTKDLDVLCKTLNAHDSIQSLSMGCNWTSPSI